MDTGVRETTAANRWELPFAWLGIQVFFTVLTLAHTFLSTLSVASCTPTSCDYSAFSAAINTFYIGALALLFLSVLAMIVLRKHARAALWAPVTGVILLLLLQVITYAASRAALTLPLFGNRVE